MKKSVWKKRLFSILTVAALILGIVFYTQMTINAEVNETYVIVTAEDIPARTKITKEMLTTLSVPSRGVPLNAVTDPKEIIGKWTTEGYGISKNSFVYEEKIVKQEDLPDAGLLELKTGEVAVPLLVDLESSLGNSIVPNTSIDLYFRSVINDESTPKALYGKMVSQVRVISVKDAQASDVFKTESNKDEVKASTEQSKSMAKIYIFAVPTELADLINKAKMLGEVIPVTTGNSYKQSLETTMEMNAVVAFLEQSSYSLPVDEEAAEGEEILETEGIVEE